MTPISPFAPGSKMSQRPAETVAAKMSSTGYILAGRKLHSDLGVQSRLVNRALFPNEMNRVDLCCMAAV